MLINFVSKKSFDYIFFFENQEEKNVPKIVIAWKKKKNVEEIKSYLIRSFPILVYYLDYNLHNQFQL
jgi:hypothetical protein